MPIMERVIQRVQKGKMNEAQELEKEWTALLKRCDFPPARWYRAFYGSEDSRVVIWEREWPDLAAMQAAYARVHEPEMRALAAQISGRSVYESNRRELYMVLPWEDSQE